jgi:phosphinothricin acetyltransferase
LYAPLFDEVRALGYRRAIAVIAQPNEASMRLHRAFGFTDVGTLHRVGWKNGAWWDVSYLELDLTPDEDPAVAPDELTRAAKHLA